MNQQSNKNELVYMSMSLEKVVVDIYSNYAKIMGFAIKKEEGFDCLIYNENTNKEGIAIEVKTRITASSLNKILESFYRKLRDTDIEISEFLIVSLGEYAMATLIRYRQIIKDFTESKNINISINIVTYNEFIKFANKYTDKEKVNEVKKLCSDINILRNSNGRSEIKGEVYFKDKNIIVDDEDFKEIFNLKNNHMCSVDGCNNIAEYAVLVFKKYKYGAISYQIDETCPYICAEHLKENELFNEKSSNNKYKYTNKNNKEGYNKYFKLEIKLSLKMLEEHCEHDYLNIDKDVEAFANLIINEDLKLPVTIGILGGWGSGKTFFTNSLVQIIKNNNKDSCIIVQFNAWNYYDSNITINLVYKIFQSIDKKIQEITDGKKTNEFIKQLNHYKNFLKEDRFNKINQINNKIEELELEQKNKKIKVVSSLSKEILEKVSFNADEINDIIQKYKGIKNNFYDLEKDIKDLLSFKELLKKNWKLILLSIALAMIIILLIKSGICRYLCSAVAFVIPNIKKIYNMIKSKFRFSNIISNYSSDLQEIDKLDYEIEKIKNEKEIEESQYNNLDEQKVTIGFLRDYIIKKLSSNGYKDNIGFINTVKNDIDNLNDIINSKVIKDKDINLNKIILIVDDLDRCPDDKVVEVLQTIQLLLSTEMFIVILAIDSKWVNNCIATVYKGMLNDDKEKSLFAINYLEKIIHIPFWIEPLNDQSSSAFIQKLSEEIKSSTIINEDSEDSINLREQNTEEPINTDNEEIAATSIINDEIDTRDKFQFESEEVNKFIPVDLSQDDIDIILRMKFFFEGISPRKIKRFFNTVLIIKYKYYSNKNDYIKLLLGTASIILKPDIFCDFYKRLFINEDINDDISLFIDEYSRDKKYNKAEKKLLESYSSYITQIFKDTNISQFRKIICESARYTYYYEEIFGK